MKKYLCFVLILCMLCLLTACGAGEAEPQEELIVFEYNNEKISLGEVYIYAGTTIDEYEEQYGDKIWEESIVTNDGLEMDVEDTARKEIIADIVKTKTLITKADKYGISLSENEKKAADGDAEDFYNKLTDEQIDEMGLTQDIIAVVLKENLLARKVYEYIMRDSGTEVSEEQARMTTFYDMFFECYSTDQFGNVVVYPASKIEEQKTKAEEAYQAIVSQTDNTDLNISFLGYTHDLKYAGSHTMSREEIISMYGGEVLDILYGMENGDISEVVETEYGYHIFQMISLTDADATAKNKELLTKQADSAYYENLITTWIAELDKGYSYSKRVDNEIYNKITFK